MKQSIFTSKTGIMLLMGFLLFLIQCQTAHSSRESAHFVSLDSQQLIVVQTAHWDSVRGSLQRYSWEGNNWQAVGEKLSINVGKNGLAWGKGIYSYENKEALHKQEGDGRSPAGIFRLLTAFGYAHPDSLKGLKFPYEHVDAFTQCIEDTASAFYNRIVNGQQIKSDWNSTDFMLRKDDLYEWGVFVGHNAGEETQAGDGSCIFMHAWRKAGSGTAGCTAMEKHHMKDIVFWLDQKKNPLLVQVPADTYSGLRNQYQLPL